MDHKIQSGKSLTSVDLACKSLGRKVGITMMDKRPGEHWVLLGKSVRFAISWKKRHVPCHNTFLSPECKNAAQQLDHLEGALKGDVHCHSRTC